MTRKSSGETFAQVKAEASNPKGDVWWGGTGDPHLQAAEEGLTQEYRSPRLGELQEWATSQARAAKYRTVGIYAGALGFGYNIELVGKNFQSYALFPHMTVLENVCYGLRASGQPRDLAAATAREGLALLGLAGLDDRLPSELSGGQQQRVAVARALVLEPRVLLFDEPLSNLDAKLRRRVRGEIRELQQRLGLSVVYVTHDQEEALAVSDRIIVMDNAVIAQHGTPAELYREPASRFVADFIGDANLVKGTLRRRDERLGAVRLGGLELSLPHRGVPDGVVDVAIRPEAVRLEVADGGSLAPGRVDDAVGAGLGGTVLKAAYLGSHMEYTVDSAIGELFVVDPRVANPLPVGARVAIGLDDDGVAVVG
jgi:iron(III) transport system ATP-binding protein